MPSDFGLVFPPLFPRPWSRKSVMSRRPEHVAVGGATRVVTSKWGRNSKRTPECSESALVHSPCNFPLPSCGSASRTDATYATIMPLCTAIQKQLRSRAPARTRALTAAFGRYSTCHASRSGSWRGRPEVPVPSARSMRDGIGVRGQKRDTNTRRNPGRVRPCSHEDPNNIVAHGKARAGEMRWGPNPRLARLPAGEVANGRTSASPLDRGRVEI